MVAFGVYSGQAVPRGHSYEGYSKVMMPCQRIPMLAQTCLLVSCPQFFPLMSKPPLLLNDRDAYPPINGDICRDTPHVAPRAPTLGHERFEEKPVVVRGPTSDRNAAVKPAREVVLITPSVARFGMPLPPAFSRSVRAWSRAPHARDGGDVTCKESGGHWMPL